jgi:hypothetical protein
VQHYSSRASTVRRLRPLAKARWKASYEVASTSVYAICVCVSGDGVYAPPAAPRSSGNVGESEAPARHVLRCIVEAKDSVVKATGRRPILHPPPNSKLKLARPGFGPAAEPPGPNSTSSASCWLQITLRRPAVCAGNQHAAVRVAARPRPRSLA